MAHVPEMLDPAITVIVSLTLGNLVVVVRESKVDSTRVDIEGAFHEDSVGHSRALDVPSWPSFSPRRVPHWLAWLGFLPQGEILFVFLGLFCDICHHSFSFCKQLVLESRIGLQLLVPALLLLSLSQILEEVSLLLSQRTEPLLVCIIVAFGFFL